MDKNELPVNSKKLKLLVGGVSKVKTKNKNKLLKQAIEDHQVNKNVHDGALTVDFRDDKPANVDIESVDVFSPHSYIKKMDESGVAVYCYSGWMDGGYQNAAIKRYMNLSNPANNAPQRP